MITLKQINLTLKWMKRVWARRNPYKCKLDSLSRNGKFSTFKSFEYFNGTMELTSTTTTILERNKFIFILFWFYEELHQWILKIYIGIQWVNRRSKNMRLIKETFGNCHEIFFFFNLKVFFHLKCLILL